VDFLPVDTVLLTRIYVLIAVEHGSRRTHLIGVSAIQLVCELLKPTAIC
jgi:putative transposase